MRVTRDRTFSSIQEEVRQFEPLLEASHDGVCISHDSNILLINQSCSSIFGRSSDEMVGTDIFDWLDFFDESSVSRWLEMQKKVYSHGLVKDIRFQQQSVAGQQKFSVNAYLHELKTIENEKIVVSIWRDISTEKSSEATLRRANIELEQRVLQQNKELRSERDNFSSLLETMADGVCITDQQGEIQYINRALEKDFGELKGCGCHEYFQGDQGKEYGELNEKVFGGKTLILYGIREKQEKYMTLLRHH